MMAQKTNRTTAVAVLGIAFIAALCTNMADAHASTSPPVKLVELMSLGAGKGGSQAGAFEFPVGVAVGPDGNAYVADSGNNRIQVLAADGKFIDMFGWEVNKTKDETSGATQTEKNICTVVSGDVCQAGVAGGLAGQMSFPAGITVDQITGNVFVQDGANARVDEFTADGKFLLMLGGEVDKTKTAEGAPTTERNICTAASGDECQAGVEWNTTPDSGAFKFGPKVSGNILTVGGPEDLLYVGDEQRVQKFDHTSGSFKGEISVPAISQAEIQVLALAIDNSCTLHQPILTESTSPTCKEFDPEYGVLYVVAGDQGGGNDHTIRKFSNNGVEVEDGHFPLTLTPLDLTSPYFFIHAIAVDPSNRLAVSQSESSGVSLSYGRLYDGRTGRLMTEFNSPSTGLNMNGLAFSGSGEFYTAITDGPEVFAYHAVPVAELILLAVPCSLEAEKETNAAYDCVLTTNVDPWGVGETEIGYEWGKTPIFGERTPTPLHPVANTGEPGEEEPLTKVEILVAGFRPNDIYYFRPFAYDANVKPPESPIAGEAGSFSTPYVAPHVSTLVVSFIKAFSVDVYGEVNPENAATEYFLEYASGKNTLSKECPNGIRGEETKCAAAGVRRTPVLSSMKYGAVAFTQEIANINPGTEYHVRIFAESRNRADTERKSTIGKEKEEASFDSASLAKPHAETGPYSALSAVGAVISAVIDTADKPVAYSFEVGVDEGPATTYGRVFTGSAMAATTPTKVETVLSNLQPETKYLYRVKVQSGDEIVWSSPLALTTPGEPILPIIQEPSLLPKPPVAFPCKRGYVRDRSGRCIKHHKSARRPRKHARKKKK